MPRRPVVRRYRGITARPPDGWPLDDVLVGVGTLRTLRELFYRDTRHRESDLWRAWDLSVRSGVSPQGSANALERLERNGLVEAFPPARYGRARRFRPRRDHPLVDPLDRLFRIERSLCVQRFGPPRDWGWPARRREEARRRFAAYLRDRET